MIKEQTHNIQSAKNVCEIMKKGIEMFKGRKRENKYGNSKCQVLGIKFDSKMEADYYLYLLAEKQDGRVLSIVLQPKLELQPSFRLAGKYMAPITYSPDFLVKYADGTEAYIDVKGDSTAQGELKRKIYLFQNPNGIPLHWITASKKYSPTGWIDYFELRKIRSRNRKIAGLGA